MVCPSRHFHKSTWATPRVGCGCSFTNEMEWLSLYYMYIIFHNTALHYSVVHCIRLYCTILLYIIWSCDVTLHCITLGSIPFRYLHTYTIPMRTVYKHVNIYIYTRRYQTYVCVYVCKDCIQVAGNTETKNQYNLSISRSVQSLPSPPQLQRPQILLLAPRSWCKNRKAELTAGKCQSPSWTVLHS